MLNFTVGPVMSSDKILEIGSEQVPYFRTSEFSKIMLENEYLMKQFSDASEASRVVFLTGSGTASMEAVVMNVFTPTDKILVIDGGSFGHRFAQICEIHDIPYERLIPEFGQGISADLLTPYEDRGFTGLLVNLDETSVGVLYDIELISDFCQRHGIFLVVDAISAFLCDSFSMTKTKAGVMITGSQKALACPPGISAIVLSSEAVERVRNNPVKSLYFNLAQALDDGARGQTPFTPAVGILLQINARLKEIQVAGGVQSEIERVAELATDFRQRIAHLPFEIVSTSLPNAVTPLHPTTASAHDIFEWLKDDYNIWVCPNGGELKDKVFRVGHIGNLTKEDNSRLIAAFEDLQKRGLI